MAKRIRAIITAEDQATKTLNKVADGFKKVAAATALLAAAAIAAAATLARTLVRQLKVSIDVAGEYEARLAALNVALAAQGDFTKEASARFTDLAKELVKVSNATETQILSALAMAKALGATDEVAEKVVRSGIDLAAIVGDTDMAFRQIIRTLSGYAGELGQTGVQIDGLTKEQLRAGAAADRVAAQFGGAGQIIATTYLGSVNNVGSAMEQLRRELGGPFSEELKNFNNNALIPFIEKMTEAESPIQNMADRLRNEMVPTMLSFGIVAVNVSAIVVAVWKAMEVAFNTAASSLSRATGFLVKGVKFVLDDMREHGTKGFKVMTDGMQQTLADAEAGLSDFSAGARAEAEADARATNKLLDTLQDLKNLLPDIAKAWRDAQDQGGVDPTGEVLKKINDAATAAKESIQRLIDLGDALTAAFGDEPFPEAPIEDYDVLQDSIATLTGGMLDFRDAVDGASTSGVLLGENLRFMMSSFTLDLEELTERMAASTLTLTDLLLSVTDNFSRGISQALNQAIFEAESFGDAVSNILESVGRTIIEFLVEAAVRAVAAALIGISAGTSQHIVRVGQLAGQTYAGAFAATAAIPIIGPALAPGVAQAALQAMLAGTSAATLAGTAVAGFAGGGIIPGINTGGDSVLIAAQPGEGILRADFTDKLIRLIDGGSGGAGSPTIIVQAGGDSDGIIDAILSFMNFRVANEGATLYASELRTSQATR